MKICLCNKIVDVKDNLGWKRIRAKMIISIGDDKVRIVAEDGQWFLRPEGTWKVIDLPYGPK